VDDRWKTWASDEWDQRRAGYRREKGRFLYQSPIIAHLLSFSTEQQLGTG